jgi:hypothetical protein
MGASFLRVKRLGCGVEHAPAYSTEVKNELSNNFALHICFLGMRTDKAINNLCKQ